MFVHCPPSSKWVPGGNSGEVKGGEERNWPPYLTMLAPQDKCPSNGHSPSVWNHTWDSPLPYLSIAIHFDVLHFFHFQFYYSFNIIVNIGNKTFLARIKEPRFCCGHAHKNHACMYAVTLASFVCSPCSIVS